MSCGSKKGRNMSDLTRKALVAAAAVVSGAFWQAATESAQTAAAATRALRVRSDMFRPFLLPQDIRRALQNGCSLSSLGGFSG